MNIIKKVFRFVLRILNSLIKVLVGFIRFINRKKRYFIPFYSLVAYILFVLLIIQFSGDSNFEKVLVNKRVNDITKINSIYVNKEIQPKSINEIIYAIQSTTGPISIGGGRFSMGGQVAYENSLHIDMREFNEIISINHELKEITVQPGIIWRDLQKAIDPFNLSVKIMQTYANFTVGGSISVNCHGRYIGHGPIISSVKEIKIINAYGDLIVASRTQNEEIFKSVIGGYGGIGVIVEVTLELEENVRVERQTQLIETVNYKDFFDKNIRNNKQVIFQNGDLYPPEYTTINNVSWVKTDKELTDTTRVTSENTTYWLEPKLVELVSWGNAGKWLRKEVLDPLYYSSEKIVWRNKEASYDVRELEPNSRKENTYVLQEYFIPVDNILSFIPKMKAIYEEYNVNIINVSLRHAYPDNESYLSWAKEEVFAFVIYYKQGTDNESKTKVRDWTIKMTDAILSENGAWYLPYQPHATIEQFKEGFPNSDKYFNIKNQQDSTHRFTNKLLDKYNPYVQKTIEKERSDIKGYFREEEQTFLTVPEWYLVFNPKEYAEFLKEGKNPSDFPFYASINEYWTIYDRSKKLVSEAYPENAEYNTMLQVIGVSITLEYSMKILYENSIGRLFSFFSNGTLSDEEKIIIDAQIAYSDFIYHTAWYEFEFMPWVNKIWTTSNTAKSNWFRKIERKLFFSFEFIFKAGYAKLIEIGAKTSYDVPVTEIFLLIETNDSITESNEVKILHEKDNKKIISITRWGAFTTNMLKLSKKNIKVLDIGGNDEIVTSLLLDKSKDFNYKDLNILYKSNLVTNDNIIRLVCLSNVSNLIDLINAADKSNIEVEHIFDY